jgi:hypothetical protein
MDSGSFWFLAIFGAVALVGVALWMYALRLAAKERRFGAKPVDEFRGEGPDGAVLTMQQPRTVGWTGVGPIAS